MTRWAGRAGVVAAVSLSLFLSLSVAGPASGDAGDLTWRGYRGVRPGEPLAVAAAHLGTAVVAACGAHAVWAGRVLLHDRASGGDGTTSSITTTSRRVHGPGGVHVGMPSSVAAKALGGKARSMLVAGHRVYLVKGPHHRALWIVGARASRRAKVTALGLSPSKALAERAVELTLSGCPVPPAPQSPPPPCPQPLPTVGPYMAVSCDPASGVVVTSCTNADWLDSDGDRADGCEREISGLVPMTFGSMGFCSQEAAMSLRDRISSGEYGLGDYYGCACFLAGTCEPSAGVWHEPGYDGIRAMPAVPHCSADTSLDPSFDCAGGTPADPPPTVALDLVQRPGDADRAVVAPQDADSDHVTIRGRVSTEDPIAMDYGGSSCQLSVDSTPGSTPDLKIDLDLVRGADPAGPPVVQNLTLTQLEDADWQVSGDLTCSLITASQVGSAVRSYLGDVLHAWTDGFLTRWCGAPDPYWWQDCPTS